MDRTETRDCLQMARHRGSIGLSGLSGFTLTGNRNRSSIFAFVIFGRENRIPLFLKF
jgi:hypothetical protein